jgi:hypothetical protein
MFTKFSNGSISAIKYKNLRTNNPYSIGAFPSGNRSYQSLYDFASALVQYDASGPASGGTLTINSNAVGSYDYTIKRGNQTVSSFTNADWFTATADTVSSFIAVDGNLTINSGVTFTPSNRKLFTCIYVNGDLTVNGTLTMNARGANHSGTAKQDIRIITGTYSSVSNPQIPSDGGAGAAAASSSNGNVTGNTGTAGTAGGSGGGASGGVRNNSGGSATTSGAGRGGTSFSGGSGGGGIWYQSGGTAGSGTVNGGAGGNGVQDTANATAFGGAGNPGGTNAGRNAATSSNGDGTGGILIIFVAGSLLGSGTISANGVQGKTYTGGETFGWSGGGGSGGGSVTVVYRYDSSTITPVATGGAGGAGGGECGSGICGGGSGGAGGAGTARKLALVA